MAKPDIVTREFFSNNTETILDLYWNHNVSIYDIADKYQVSYNVLSRQMAKNHMLKPQGKTSIKYTVDNTYFETIDTEQKAYWLGVLYADGNISHIRNSKYVTFSSIDKDWLSKYKNCISFSGPILKEHHNKFNKDIYKVKVTSEHLYKSLLTKGITERKSKTIVFPNFTIVPENLMKHFVRGYFDGDGSVGVYQNKKDAAWKRLHASFSCGSLEFILGLYEWCVNNNIHPLQKPRKKANKEVYILNFSLIAGLQLRDLIYSDASVYLTRKYEKFYSVSYPKRTFNDYNRVSQTGIKE